jgi:hypothetical protein
VSITEAAVFLAQQWPVFPCGADKAPLTAHGLHDAVADEPGVRDLFHRPGVAMIGVPTGAVSGFVAVDLDVKEGRPGLEWLAANEHRIPRTRRHSTQSGGVHLLFAAPEGRRIRNSASKLAPGVDVRGDGGYVIVPPSPGYAITDDAMPAPMPGWLLDLVDPPVPEPAAIAPRREVTSGDGSKYGLAALDSECEAIMAAPFGQQETTLNGACLKIGALVAGGEIAADFAIHSLTSAALGMASQPGKTPWNPSKLREKVRRDFADGQRQPRQAPPRQPRITVTVEPPHDWPEPPPYDAPPEHWQAETDYQPAAPAPRSAEQPKPAQQPQPRILPVVMFSDAQPKLDANDFVEGVLSCGAMSVVYGESNSGKTFFALDMALHVAAGMQWRDREVDQGVVLYLALEGSAAILNRVAAFKIANDMGDHVLPFAIAPVAVNLLDPEADAAAVIDTIKAVAAKMESAPMLVIVDTLARAIAGGNENASEDMGALVRNGDLIREATGAHLMWIHHSGKDQAKGARGHSSLRAATDTEIEVVAVSTSRTASVTKQRDMECTGTFTFSLKVIELGNNTRGKAVTSCVVEAGEGDTPGGVPLRRRLKGHQQRALEVLADLIAHSGRTGDPGVPHGLSSVPDKWWRERFYERAMPGAEAEARKRAFRRAADYLVEHHLVGMGSDRVWLVHSKEDGT